MTKTQLQTVLLSLSKTRPVFHSEDDLKVHLAIELMTNYKYLGITDVHLEKPEKIKMFYKNKLHNTYYAPIDILVEFKKEIIPIELKYKTKADEIDCPINKTIKYNLKDQGAYPESLFRFRRDILRVEEIKKKYNSSKGYVILITNDDYYTKPVRKGTFASGYSIDLDIPANDPGWDYSSTFGGKLIKKSFNLYEHVTGKKHWTCKGDNYLKLDLSKSYKTSWNTFSTCLNTMGSKTNFKYCLIEV